MRSIFFANLWKWKTGEPEYDIQYGHFDLKIARETEWSGNFEQLMRNRLIMGSLRYHSIAEKDRPKYKAIENAIQRLKSYLESGNQENLVDVANICMIEYCHPNVKNAHFSAVDDGIHVKKGKKYDPHRNL